MNMILLLNLLIVTTLCSLQSQNDDARVIKSIRDLEVYLNRHLDSLPKINHYSKQRIKVEGDEGEYWFAEDYYNGNEIVISMETNWVDTCKVSRITVYSPQIKLDNIYVGQKFGLIRNAVKKINTSSSDGSIFLNIKGDSRVNLHFDVINNEQLYYGISDLNMIPDSLRITSIIIM